MRSTASLLTCALLLALLSPGPAPEATEPDPPSVQEWPVVTWRWRVDSTIDDRNTADAKGTIRSAGDDFAAKIGFQMLSRDSENLREIAYVWTRAIPEGSVLVQKADFLFWRYRFYRIVARSGQESVGTWQRERRDLRADYRMIWPDEEPGKLIRIFLMADGDNTGSVVSTSFADIRFHHRERRP